MTIDRSRISFGEMVAGVSGLLLFLFMFVDWYGVGGALIGLNAWQAFSLVDLLLFLVLAAAVALPVLRATGAMPALPPATPGRVVAVAGALAFIVVLGRLLIPPFATDREIGVFLGLLATAGIAFGGYTAARERTTGSAPPA